MWLKFSKMHSLGKDLVVIDLITQTGYLRRELIQELGLRHRGIGFSQLMIIEQPRQADMDFYFRLFNADGSDAEVDSAAVRCVLRFAQQQQLTGKACLQVQSQARYFELRLKDRQQVMSSFSVDELAGLDQHALDALKASGKNSALLMLPEGELEVAWQDGKIALTGSVETVYEGRINI